MHLLVLGLGLDWGDRHDQYFSCTGVWRLGAKHLGVRRQKAGGSTRLSLFQESTLQVCFMFPTSLPNLAFDRTTTSAVRPLCLQLAYS